MKEEIWREIPNFKNYFASNFGKIISKKRGKEIILKQSVNQNGYCKVNLYIEDNKKTMKVHTLIAITFLSFIPCGMDLVVDHIDNNKQNNNLNNLQILTQKENHLKALKFKEKTSSHLGINREKRNGKWVVRFYNVKPTVYLGRFDTEQEALREYKRAEEEFNNTGKITVTTPSSFTKTSKYKGICWCRKREKWRAQKTINGKSKHIGYFETEELALNNLKNK